MIAVGVVALTSGIAGPLVVGRGLAHERARLTLVAPQILIGKLASEARSGVVVVVVVVVGWSLLVRRLRRLEGRRLVLILILVVLLLAILRGVRHRTAEITGRGWGTVYTWWLHLTIDVVVLGLA